MISGFILMGFLCMKMCASQCLVCPCNFHWTIYTVCMFNPIFVCLVLSLLSLINIINFTCLCILVIERNGMNMGGWGSGQDLEGIGGGKTIIKIYCIEKTSIFNFIKKIYTATTTKTKYKRVLFILFSSKAADAICISESFLGKVPSLSPHIQAYA